jgi:putative thioredoxin
MTSHDITDFSADVIERSFSVPVVVDFWAEWCAPCRMLGPVLEALAARSDGAWELRKLNTEDFPDIAEQYGIRSIPAVKLFVDGRVQDEFSGALPEQAVEQWLREALPDRHADSVALAEGLFAAGRLEEARRELEPIVEAAPDHETAAALLAATLFFSDRARSLAIAAPIETGPAEERAGALRTMDALLGALRDGAALPDGPMRDRYREGLVALERADFDAALPAFVDVLKSDRYYLDDSARKACIAIFKFLGEAHAATLAWRREFDRSLY